MGASRAPGRRLPMRPVPSIDTRLPLLYFGLHVDAETECSDGRGFGNPRRGPSLRAMITSGRSWLDRYQTARIRYLLGADSPMTWAVGDFYRPDLARAGRKPGRNRRRGHHQRVRV